MSVTEKEMLRGTAFDAGQTSIGTGGEEYGGPGRIRNTLTLSQNNIDIFGTIAKSSLNTSRIAAEKERLEVTKLQTALAVYQAYYDAVNAREQRKLALQMDSIYGDFLRAAKLRYETEATTRLELLAAEGQYGAVVAQKIEAENNYRKALNVLNRWILEEFPFDVEPVSGLFAGEGAWKRQPEDHPLMRLARLETRTSESLWRTEKAAFLPKLNASYGWQEVAGQSGFYSWNLGLSVPLFFWNQGAKTKAAKIGVAMAKERSLQQENDLKTEMRATQNDYDRLSATVKLYRNQLLPLAMEQIAAANLSYREGEIDYVSFIQNLNNAKEVQREYLDRLREYNATVIRLRYLTAPETLIDNL